MGFRFADYEIDIGRQELRRGGEVVPVEPQVFDVLVYLIRHRDRVVSKEELIDAVWNGRIISETALSSRISAARRVVGDTGNAQNLIRTHHKRGFRFVGQIEDETAPDVRGESAKPGAPPAEAAHDLPRPVAASPVLPLPDKPAVAVLPFENMSGDAEQEYFADGLTEDLITGLSRQRWFFVIARNTTFAFKGQAVDVRKVAAQLGVKYVLEGSVRRAGGRVRVTGQLIDADRGIHLWADKYDRELTDIFQLQDDITNRVIGAVGSQILLAEAAGRVRRTAPQNIDAWDLVLQALPQMWRMSTEGQLQAQQLLSQAIALDPDYAHAHALLGWSYINMFNLDTRRPIGEFTDLALASGEKSAALDDQEPWSHLVLGLGHSRKRRPEIAFAHLSQAIDLNPSFALAYAGYGYALACGGQPERGLQALEQAQRLSPRDPFLAIYAPTVRYMALFALGRYDEAVAVCRTTAGVNPNHAGAWRLMTVSLGLLGRIDEAKEALAHVLKFQPNFSSAHVANNTVFADPDDRARFLEGLRNAGLKD